MTYVSLKVSNDAFSVFLAVSFQVILMIKIIIIIIIIIMIIITLIKSNL